MAKKGKAPSKPSTRTSQVARFRRLLREVIRGVLTSLPEPSLTEVQTIRFTEQGAAFPMELRPDFGRLAVATLSLAPKMPEFQRLLRYIRRTKWLSDELLVDAGGNPVSDEESQAWWLTQFWVGPFVSHYLTASGSGWSEPTFRGLFRALVERIERPTIQMVVTAPLYGFTSEVEQFELDSRVRIRRIGEEEKRRYWETYASFPPGGTGQFTLNDLLAWTHVAEVRFGQEKPTPQRAGLSQRAGDPSDALLTDFVTVLRLQKPNRVGIVFRIFAPDGPAFGTPLGHLSRATIPPIAMWPPEYEVAEEEVEDLRNLFGRLRAYRREPVYDLALSRFNLAYDRTSDEDRLINYWIALEALFLPDGGQELSYRASLRVARFIGGSPKERRRVFYQMRDSYTDRSLVVHGKAREVANLHEITLLTEEVVRRALQLWLDPSRSHRVKDLDSALLD